MSTMEKEMKAKLKDRIAGCLIGGAIGDAMGMPFEEIPKSKIEKIYGRDPVESFIDGEEYKMRHAIEAGSVTDDTELVLATTQSIVNCSEINIKNIMDHLRQWYERKLTWLRGDLDQRNIGFTTTQAIMRYINGYSYKETGLEKTSCGPVIRISPIAVATYNDYRNLKAAVFAAARLTHNNPTKPLAEESAFCFALCIRYILLNKPIPNMLRYVLSLVKVRELKQAINKISFGLKENWSSENAVKELGCGSSYIATEVVSLAIYNFLNNCEDFRSAVLASANARSSSGCDTDCIASLTGALSGCYLTAKRIPREWKSDVEYASNIEGFSSQLSNLVLESNGKTKVAI